MVQHPLCISQTSFALMVAILLVFTLDYTILVVKLSCCVTRIIDKQPVQDVEPVQNKEKTHKEKKYSQKNWPQHQMNGDNSLMTFVKMIHIRFSLRLPGCHPRPNVAFIIRSVIMCKTNTDKTLHVLECAWTARNSTTRSPQIRSPSDF